MYQTILARSVDSVQVTVHVRRVHVVLLVVCLSARVCVCRCPQCMHLYHYVPQYTLSLHVVGFAATHGVISCIKNKHALVNVEIHDDDGKSAHSYMHNLLLLPPSINIKNNV